jgi:uncharacterized membrane protein YfcA
MFFSGPSPSTSGKKPAVVLASVPLLVTNAAILFGMRSERGAVRRFLPTLAVPFPATYLGGRLVSAIPGGIAAIVVGTVTIAFVAVTLFGCEIAVPERADRLAQVLLGGGAGLLNGATSIPGPLFAIYLSTLALDKRAFVYSVTLLVIVGNAAQVGSYLALGLNDNLFVTSAALAPAQLIGQQIGVRIQGRLQASGLSAGRARCRGYLRRQPAGPRRRRPLTPNGL